MLPRCALMEKSQTQGSLDFSFAFFSLAHRWRRQDAVSTNGSLHIVRWPCHRMRRRSDLMLLMLMMAMILFNYCYWKEEESSLSMAKHHLKQHSSGRKVAESNQRSERQRRFFLSLNWIFIHCSITHLLAIRQGRSPTQTRVLFTRIRCLTDA